MTERRTKRKKPSTSLMRASRKDRMSQSWLIISVPHIHSIHVRIWTKIVHCPSQPSFIALFATTHSSRNGKLSHMHRTNTHSVKERLPRKETKTTKLRKEDEHP